MKTMVKRWSDLALALILRDGKAGACIPPDPCGPDFMCVDHVLYYFAGVCDYNCAGTCVCRLVRWEAGGSC
jgi:hypothetical protein